MSPVLLYLHGFLSSPNSEKAVQTAQFNQASVTPVEFVAPALPNFPAQAYSLLQDTVEGFVARGREVVLIGSSMGGFLATALAERFGLKTVLINPSVRPYDHADHFLGENLHPYTGERFVLESSHIDELRQIEAPQITDPTRYLLLVQTGDEVLDYRKAVDYYRDCEQQVIEGGHHRFENYPQQLPDIFHFLGLSKHMA